MRMQSEYSSLHAPDFFQTKNLSKVSAVKTVLIFVRMCYNAESATLKGIKYALHRGDDHLAEELQRQLDELVSTQGPRYHVSAFAHPALIGFAQDKPFEPRVFSWGLIPSWTKTAADAKKIRTQTLNARGESIFDKPAFRGPARNKRCIIYLDAFYEHHHAGKTTYPFRISMKDGSPMAVAGLWDEWVDKESGEVLSSCTIVTTKANTLMSRIHNNPNAGMGPRMPVILPKEKQDHWLTECKTDQDRQLLESLIRPLDDGLLQAHTVARINGKNAVGNVPEVREKADYKGFDWLG